MNAILDISPFSPAWVESRRSLHGSFRDSQNKSKETAPRSESYEVPSREDIGETCLPVKACCQKEWEKFFSVSITDQTQKDGLSLQQQ